MTRYSIALTTLLSTTLLTTPVVADPWSYLSVGIPIALSDMAVTVMTYTTAKDGNATSTATTNGDAAAANGGEVTKKIMLTGGCVSEKGNEFLGEYFACLELTNKAYSFTPIPPKTQFQAWTGTFESLPDMPRERARHNSFQLGNNLLCVIGGRDTSDTLIAPIDCYDATTNVWTEVGTLPDEYLTSDAAAYASDNTVHLIGGYKQDYEALSQVTVVDMSDLTNIQFTKGVPIDTPRGDINVVEVEDGSALMISGGFTHLNDFSAPLNSVEKFQFDSQTWGPVDALNEERGDKQLINLNGKIYAMGGEGRVDASGPVPDEALAAITMGSIVLDTVEVLDLTAGKDGDEVEWKTQGDMPSSLFRFGASGWNEEVIFVFGGQVGFETECECFRTTEKVLVFDPKKSLDHQADTLSAGVAISVVVGHVVAVAAMVVMMLA